MKTNTLGIYLTSFTNEDWSLFHKFSKSRYSENSDFQAVINYIKKHKSRIDAKKMDTEYLRKKIRPTYSKHVFSNVISGLCKHIEAYFRWSEMESDPMMKDTLLLQALGKRGLTKQFFKQKEKAKERRSNLPIGLWEGYHEFMAEYLLYYCNMTSDSAMSKVSLKNGFISLKEFQIKQWHYFIIEMNNRQLLLKEDWGKNLELFKKEYTFKHNLSDIFDHLIEMKNSKSEKSYLFLIEKIKGDEISTNLKYTILIHLRSYLSHLIVKGRLDVTTNLLELQKFGLDEGILFPNGRIPLIRFTNILNTASSLKEYKWANDFVSKYSHLVINQNSNETKSLGFAQIEFSKKNYSEVINLLFGFKFKNIEFELRAKWLLLSSNYEINNDNYSVIESNVKAFRYFLNKNRLKITELSFLSYLNCSKLLIEIARHTDKDLIISKIKNEKNLIYRGWLLKKITEK
ncbi:MAG: hypothetical protein P1U56_02915 [Saprospiraceae bacterium]|nr:hypothetical protein [Saprospiraceae bacterium]